MISSDYYKFMLHLYYLITFLVLISCSYRTAQESVNKNISTTSQNRLNKLCDLPENKDLIKISAYNLNSIWIISKRNLWQSSDGCKTWNVIYSIDRQNISDIQNKSSLLVLQDFQIISPELLILKTNKDLIKLKIGNSAEILTHTLFDKNFVYRGMYFFENGNYGWLYGETFKPYSSLDKLPSNFISPGGKLASFGSIYRVGSRNKTFQNAFTSSTPDKIISSSFSENKPCFLGLKSIYCKYKKDGKWVERKIVYDPVNESEPLLQQTINMCIFENLIWISLRNGSVIFSDNDGVSWVTLFHPSKDFFERSENEFFQKILFKNKEIGYGLSSDGCLYVSKDGGKHWDKFALNNKIKDFVISENKIISMSEDGVYLNENSTN